MGRDVSPISKNPETEFSISKLNASDISMIQKKMRTKETPTKKNKSGFNSSAFIKTGKTDNDSYFFEDYKENAEAFELQKKYDDQKAQKIREEESLARVMAK